MINIDEHKVSDAIDVPLDLETEILRLKKELKAVILAHYYQESEIQDLADYVGDSLELARRAAETDADVIVFAGVHFMAETAKILNPHKLVLLPDLEAGCSLAEGCPAPDFKQFREMHPDHVAITYINCSAEVKALSDIICTSSSAEKIINQIPKDTPILFSPDKNLGAYLAKKTGRTMLLWNGSCIVHETFSERKIIGLQMEHPDAKLIAHPECEAHLLARADFIGSTSALAKICSVKLSERVYRRNRSRHYSSNAKKRPGEVVHPCSSRCKLRLQRMPAHEAEHHGKAVSLHEEQIAGNNNGTRIDPTCAAADPTDDGDELERAVKSR